MEINTANAVSILGVLVALTNVIVQVVKKLTWDRLPTNTLTVITAQLLTLGSFFAWLGYSGTRMLWYYAAAALVAGMLVAYAAMFGFDKLKQTMGVSENV